MNPETVEGLGLFSPDAAEEVGALIVKARHEIAILCAPQMVSEELPDAQRHMDAVISMTEKAAHAIMDEAEAIMAQGDAEAAPDKEARDASCMRIIEACEFQDITGQRVAKVLKTLQTLEIQLARLQEALGLDKQLAPLPNSIADGEVIDGPAFEGEGVNQDSIDDLFKD